MLYFCNVLISLFLENEKGIDNLNFVASWWCFGNVIKSYEKEESKSIEKLINWERLFRTLTYVIPLLNLSEILF